MSFANKVLKTGSTPIHYLVSKDANDRDCYYILICPKEKLTRMLADKTALVSPQEFGHVIDSGFGKRPPESVVEMLKREYHFDIDA